MTYYHSFIYNALYFEGFLMSNLANFCNRIGIDSECLRVVKKDNILYNKKTAEPLVDWVLFNAITNPLRNKLIFHNFGDDSNLYAEPCSSALSYVPISDIIKLANETTTFIRGVDKHVILGGNQIYSTNLFSKACQGINHYKMIYPFDNIGNFSFQVEYYSKVLTLKLLSTSLMNRANLDILDADNYAYSARLNFHCGANQKMHFAPHYITDFAAPINRQLMTINRAIDDLCMDLQQIKGFLKSNIVAIPEVNATCQGHYFNLFETDTGVQVSFDTFFKFLISREQSLKLARKFIHRYHEYNDPIALHIMKMLDLLTPLALETMSEHDIYSFYHDIDAFEHYLTVFEMTTI